MPYSNSLSKWFLEGCILSSSTSLTEVEVEVAAVAVAAVVGVVVVVAVEVVEEEAEMEETGCFVMCLVAAIITAKVVGSVSIVLGW